MIQSYNETDVFESLDQILFIKECLLLESVLLLYIRENLWITTLPLYKHV